MILCVTGFSFVSVFDTPLSIIGNAKGDTLYVNTTGSNGAYTSIQEAINAANYFDTVFVYSGIYTQKVTINKRINLTGEDRDNTVINGGGSGDVVRITVDWVHMSGFKVIGSGSGAGDAGIEMKYVDNCTIMNNNLSNNKCGLWIENANENTIFNNFASNNYWGISLYSANRNEVSKNTAVNCASGITLSDANYNNITNNNASSNDWAGIHLSGPTNCNIIAGNDAYLNNHYGFRVYDASNNFFENNNVSLNKEHGIILYVSSTFNIITGNNVISNTNYGICIWEPSNNNTIFRNDILYNNGGGIQAFDSGMNRWNETYPIGGNYWSGYGGIDNKKGPNQNISGSDGIGDVPYDIDTDSKDYYPLMGPINTYAPMIQLIFPVNNSIIQAGTLLDFFVYDNDLVSVNYSINSAIDLLLSNPFDISTSGWVDGEYTIQINALDSVGNSTSSSYFFIIDFTEPSIFLNAPANCSVIPDGTILDFSIVDSYLIQVNYSVNGGINISFFDPFDISTLGWDDGDYTIHINALDIAGNLKTSWYFFIIDSTEPDIRINSPENNSIIPSGTILDLSILDQNLMHVNISVDNEDNISLSEPFDIFTEGWSDGDCVVQINAIDMAGNSNSLSFFFTIDSVRPAVILNAPLNCSIIPDGTELDFSITDLNLKQVKYSVNGGSNFLLFDPFNISTTGWVDGDYLVQINAIDSAGNSKFSLFFFTIDSKKPTIIFNFPGNNSVIQNGTSLDFLIEDSNLFSVNYSVNKGAYFPLIYPYNINTSSWPDGDYVIQINSLDLAGNSNSLWYLIAIDSESPVILFDNNLNHSIIPSAKAIQLSISDLYLESVSYSLNEDDYIDLTPPYIIDTSSFQDGFYLISIKANDTAQNEAEIWFEVTIDAIFPHVVSSNPQTNSTDIEISTTIYITFSEPMNQLHPKNYLFISPIADCEINWDETGRILLISFEKANLVHGTSYNLIIDSEISDINGNPMTSDFVLFFTTETASTEPSNGDKNSGVDQLGYTWLLLLIIIILVAIIVFLLIGKGIRKTQEGHGPKGETGMSEVMRDEELEEIKEPDMRPPPPPPDEPKALPPPPP